MPWLFLLGAGMAGIGAYLVGWPAWTSYRGRETRDLNAERYLAWRGRARESAGSQREGPTTAERRRLWLAAALALAALGWLIAFFGAT
jgi:hypothetical protein